MRRFFALLKKDILLFFSHGKGVAVLLLFPLCLLAVLSAGMGELSEKRVYLQPFPIAVVDEDQTWMSALLIEQVQQISIFSEVRVLPEAEVDTLFSDGCACVVVLPKDYFYDLYRSKGTIEIHLNDATPTAAAVCETALTQILDVVSETQRTYRAVYELQYGDDATDADWEAFCASTSTSLVADGLAIMDAIHLEDVQTDAAAETRRMAAAAVLSLIAMLAPLYVLKTVPEEGAIGMEPRIASFGVSRALVLSSKFCTALPIFLVVALPFVFALFGKGAVSLIPALLLCFVASFAWTMFLSALLLRVSRLMTVANALLVASLLLGGCLYPIQLFPAFFRNVAACTLPYHLLRAIAQGASWTTLRPFVVFAVVGLLLAMLCEWSRRRRV